VYYWKNRRSGLARSRPRADRGLSRPTSVFRTTIGVCKILFRSVEIWQYTGAKNPFWSKNRERPSICLAVNKKVSHHKQIARRQFRVTIFFRQGRKHGRPCEIFLSSSLTTVQNLTKYIFLYFSYRVGAYRLSQKLGDDGALPLRWDVADPPPPELPSTCYHFKFGNYSRSNGNRRDPAENGTLATRISTALKVIGTDSDLSTSTSYWWSIVTIMASILFAVKCDQCRPKKFYF